MNRIQKRLLYTFLPLTVIIVLLDNFYPGNLQINYIKYAVILALFLATLRIRKRCREQVFMNIAVFFIVVADFFLVFCDTIPELSHKVVPWGMLGFLVAYSFLILAFSKNSKLGWRELLAAVPVLALFVPNYVLLLPHVSGIMFYGASFFSIVLCYMTWTAVCTIFWRYYTPAVARRIALAGYLILICDVGVSQAFFNPAFKNQFSPWLTNIIWAAYVPGWTLIVLTIAEEKLYPVEGSTNHP